MVSYYLKPLGPEYHQLGIQDRIQYPPTIKIYASLIIYLFLYPFSHLAGSLISHSRRSDLPGPSRSRKDGLLFSPLPGQKTKRVKPDDNKLKGLEQVHHLQTFPHGIGKICDPNHLHRLLHVHNRSARRLLSRPNSPIISKILKIFCPLSRGFCPTLSVSGSPLWDFISSKSVYKDHGGGGCFSETSGSIYHPLFRRPADCGKRQFRSHYSKRSYDIQAFRVGMVNKHPKVRSFSLHPQEIPWCNVRFHSSDVLSSSGESGRSETTRSLLQNEDFYINPRSHEDLRTPYSLSPISGLESKSFSHPTELDSEQLGSKTLRFGQEGHHPILSKKKFTVVVTEKEPGERGPLALSSASHNCDRRKQCGLGSGLPFPLRPRSMDAFPIPEAIKLSRATGHLGSPKAKYTSPEKPPCTHFIRQHHSGVLRRQGGTRSTTLSTLTHTIFSWAEENVLSLSATHLRGVLNKEADYLSREQISPNEWSINPEVFIYLTSLWGIPQIDLFATKKNTVCHRYYTLEAGAPKDRLDAFSHRWVEPLSYAFPPIPLVARVLRKILTDQARVILICPNWPKKNWYPLLTSLTQQQPVILPSRRDLLHQGPILHPDPGRLQLTAWILSPNS
ncbi:uncharacterized protein [Engystomops pustulosus]|uniref:uncharacterized protein n=1 Tax=Engystomops pustulosus TaxID=76066 RepID=UPI003AFA9740